MSADYLEWGRSVLQQEAESLISGAKNLSSSFEEAVKTILQIKGRVIVSGLGKSGHIGAKIAATLASTGTPSFYIHPSEAMHGDFGMILKDDLLLAVAYGGETREVLSVCSFCKDNNIPVLAITGKANSQLAKSADITVLATVAKEADSLNLAPTASSTLTLAIGDALAVSLMKARDFKIEHFARLHPGGKLGSSLKKVQTVMWPKSEFTTISKNTNFEGILGGIAAHNFGIVAIVDANETLIGVISDGDLRRTLLEKKQQTFEITAQDIMNKQPKTILVGARVLEAVSTMEENKITSLFVVDSNAKVLGLIRLHDIISAKIV